MHGRNLRPRLRNSLGVVRHKTRTLPPEVGRIQISQALAWLGAHAPKSRVVVITDGVVTAGDTTEALRATDSSLVRVCVCRSAPLNTGDRPR